MAQYFFDVTDLRNYLTFHTQLSGIQRVSVSTIARAVGSASLENIWLSYHDKMSNTYWACQCPKDLDVNLLDHSDLSQILDIHSSLRTLPGMSRYRSSPAKLELRATLWDIRAHLGQARYFKRRGITPKAWLEARAAHRIKRRNKKASDVAPRKFEFREVAKNGDHLVLLDNAWQPDGLDNWLSIAAQQLGVNVTVLLHDLIPLVRPQYTTSTICKKFNEWIKNSTSYVTRYIANSESTAADLRAFLISMDAAQPISVVPLAQAQLPGVQSHKASREGNYPKLSEFKLHQSMPDNIRVITKTPYVLVVGTMEVRKNLWQLATVWDRLRKQSGRPLPKLVLAGRDGWLNDDFDTLMEATGRLGGWVEIIEGPDDSVLDYLYRNCLFTITTSFYEGWGLPIGESLAYGKTAVVSRTSSMPEVGGDMVEYCNPHNIDSIEAACLKLIDDPQHRGALEARISTTDLRTWEDVTQDMLAAVTRD